MIVRRAPEDSAGGYWTPVTGKIDRGETMQETVVRECREEVGLTVECLDEIYRCPTHNGRFMLVWFRAKLVGDDRCLPAPDEVAEALWVTPQEALELAPMFPATRDYYQRCLHEAQGES